MGLAQQTVDDDGGTQAVDRVLARENEPFVVSLIRERAYRHAVYQDIVDRLHRLIAARAEAYKDVRPGGDTGLLVETTRSLRKGKKTIIVREYAIDGAVLSELRQYTRQAAIEAGEWQEEARAHQPPPGPDLSGLTSEQLFEEQRILREAMQQIEAVRTGKPQPVLIEAAMGTVEAIEG